HRRRCSSTPFGGSSGFHLSEVRDHRPSFPPPPSRRSDLAIGGHHALLSTAVEKIFLI
ncbi:unnamed protein product, partial [Musa textilis]